MCVCVWQQKSKRISHAQRKRRGSWKSPFAVYFLFFWGGGVGGVRRSHPVRRLPRAGKDLKKTNKQKQSNKPKKKGDGNCRGGRREERRGVRQKKRVVVVVVVGRARYCCPEKPPFRFLLEAGSGWGRQGEGCGARSRCSCLFRWGRCSRRRGSTQAQSVRPSLTPPPCPDTPGWQGSAPRFLKLWKRRE